MRNRWKRRRTTLSLGLTVIRGAHLLRFQPRCSGVISQSRLSVGRSFVEHGSLWFSPDFLRLPSQTLIRAGRD